LHRFAISTTKRGVSIQPAAPKAPAGDGNFGAEVDFGLEFAVADFEEILPTVPGLSFDDEQCGTGESVSRVVLSGDGSAGRGDGVVGSGCCDLRFSTHDSSWLEVTMRDIRFRAWFLVKLLVIEIDIS